MKTWTLERRQFLAHNREKVFEFFREPANLARITPPSLGFVILTPQPVRMGAGLVIDYTVSPFGFPLHWRTLIAEYDPPSRFVDVQIKGPYAMWHHTHLFEEESRGTVMTDRVVYALPLGPAGRLIHVLAVRRRIEAIFDYRARVIGGLLNGCC